MKKLHRSSYLSKIDIRSRIDVRKRHVVALACAAAVFIGSAIHEPSAALAKPSHKPRVLIVGDSVFSMLGVADKALAELNRKVPVIFGGQPCQKLLVSGCMPNVKLSAMARFRAAKGKFTDAIVVATGYNENHPTALLEALDAFRKEAKRQHVKLVWATYRVAGNVVQKSTNFNRQLREAAKRDKSLVLFDWNSIAAKKPSWFSGDKIHLSRGGAMQLARHLGKFLDEMLTTKVSTTTQA